MRRRASQNKKESNYSLTTNQGTPDVYVDGEYVGTVSNGRLDWYHEPYTNIVTVTLQNVDTPPPSTTSITQTNIFGLRIFSASSGNVSFRPFNFSGETFNIYDQYSPYTVEIGKADNQRTTSYRNVLSANLRAGVFNIAIDYVSSLGSSNYINWVKGYYTINQWISDTGVSTLQIVKVSDSEFRFNIDYKGSSPQIHLTTAQDIRQLGTAYRGYEDKYFSVNYRYN